MIDIIWVEVRRVGSRWISVTLLYYLDVPARPLLLWNNFTFFYYHLWMILLLLFFWILLFALVPGVLSYLISTLQILNPFVLWFLWYFVLWYYIVLEWLHLYRLNHETVLQRIVSFFLTYLIDDLTKLLPFLHDLNQNFVSLHTLFCRRNGRGFVRHLHLLAARKLSMVQLDYLVVDYGIFSLCIQIADDLIPWKALLLRSICATKEITLPNTYSLVQSVFPFLALHWLLVPNIDML